VAAVILVAQIKDHPERIRVSPLRPSCAAIACVRKSPLALRHRLSLVVAA
jgi:hypothetical protein